MTKPARTLLLLLIAVIFVVALISSVGGPSGAGGLMGGKQTVTLTYNEIFQLIKEDKVITATWQQNQVNGELHGGSIGTKAFSENTPYTVDVPDKDTADASQLQQALIGNSKISFTYGHPPMFTMVLQILSVLAFPALILALIYFLLIRPAQMGGNQALSFGRSKAKRVGESGPKELPAGRAVVRVSFWVSSLGSVLDALAAAGADAGVRQAVSGPAGAGALYACLDPDTSDDDAARFVTVLRERIGGALGARSGVVVLAASPPVLEAVSATGTIPGAALMRAVKDQFDPGHQMFPGRFAGGD